MQVNRRFTIHEVPTKERGKRKITKYVKDENWTAERPIWNRVDEEIPYKERLFDVRMRGGLSQIRVTETEARRLGFFENPEMINIDTGDLIPTMDVIMTEDVKEPTHVR
jgi:hypothetical protein